MKYIIPENKIDKIVFRYLDNTLKNLEKRKPKYFKGYVFVYPDKEYGILGWKNDGTLYINKELIDEISNGFGLKDFDSKSIISRWASDRYQLEVNNTSRRAFMNWRLASDRLQLEVNNTKTDPIPNILYASDRLQLEVKNTLTPIRISQDDIQ